MRARARCVQDTVCEDEAVRTTLAQWIVDVIVNPRTSISTVKLPFYSQEHPLQGTKTERDKILKLLTGMFNDYNPLRMRYEKDKEGEDDPYFKSAPGWSTLSGGRTPWVVAAPYELCVNLIRACGCSEMVKRVDIYVAKADGTKELVSLEKLKELNIVVKPVPNLYKKKVASTMYGAQPPSAQPPSVDVAAFSQKQKELEEQVTLLQAALNEAHEKISSASTSGESPEEEIVSRGIGAGGGRGAKRVRNE